MQVTKDSYCIQSKLPITKNYNYFYQTYSISHIAAVPLWFIWTSTKSFGDIYINEESPKTV